VSNQTDVPETQPPLHGGEVLGHPKALWQLFNIELWERFAYYGMRAVLAIYIADVFFDHMGEAEANQMSGLIYGGYTALVYATGIIGGYIADKVLGYQRSILLGAIVMASGLFVLLIEDFNWFLAGLALIVAGNGLFKPNISVMIGKLYAPGDARRDSGFTIFYMGINLGAFLAPLVTSTWIGVNYGMKYGFLAAGIGMILSTLFLEFAKKSLGKVGLPDEDKQGWGPFFGVAVGCIGLAAVVYYLLTASTVLGFVMIGSMTVLSVYLLVTGKRAGKVQFQRNIAMLLLFLANTCFWALFEQAGSSLNVFAREFTTPMFGDATSWREGGFAIFQSLNPLYILLFAPVFAAAWPKLEKMGMNPSTPRKFALALFQVTAGFYLLVLAVSNMQNAAGLVPWIFLALSFHGDQAG
jgi:POT family proton-dependent oligopeptide transporter